MSQSVVRLPVQAQDRQQLRLEKVGVIGGFLLGLVVAAGGTSLVMSDLGAPEWVAFAAFGLTVAASTRAGLWLATALSRKSDRS
jgi:uncharacterized membrane protein YfcA